ncbi:MAG: imidazole glycerol phosphate synthase subunit HisH [Bacteroidota bacterium]
MAARKYVIIKYNAGNIRSLDFALRRLGVEAEITDDHEKIKSAYGVIFPGVGEAGSTMNYLRERGMDILIKNLRQPVLGICLGQQLLCSWSEEGRTSCIGVFPDKVLKFPPQGKIPHMGWNSLDQVSGDLFSEDMQGEYCYFVHSYYVPLSSSTAAITNYLLPFSAALQKDNFFATQFHPEKSGDVGSRILAKFIDL